MHVIWGGGYMHVPAGELRRISRRYTRLYTRHDIWRLSLSLPRSLSLSLSLSLSKRRCTYRPSVIYLIVNSSEELEIDEFSDEFSLELDRSDLGPSLRAASSQP